MSLVPEGPEDELAPPCGLSSVAAPVRAGSASAACAAGGSSSDLGGDADFAPDCPFIHFGSIRSSDITHLAWWVGFWFPAHDGGRTKGNSHRKTAGRTHRREEEKLKNG